VSSKKAVTVAAVGAAAAVAARTLIDRRTNSSHDDLHRWRVVTVQRELGEVAVDVPEPLAALGDAVEVQTAPAPGDRGTELRARWRDGAETPAGEDPVRRLRLALRESKQLLEVGWVLEPDRNTTNEATALNAPLRKAIKVARGEGLL
jgi:hypothetical protein